MPFSMEIYHISENTIDKKMIHSGFSKQIQLSNHKIDIFICFPVIGQ